MGTGPFFSWAQRAFIQFLLGLPPGVRRRLVGSRQHHVVDGEALHPDLQLLLALRDWVSRKPLREGSLQRSRKILRRDTCAHGGRPLKVAGVREYQIEGPAHAIRARHYLPPTENGERPPLLVFFHGGGFALCDLETHDAPCRFLCLRSRVHVLSVEYRLAPEHPFPAAVEDGFVAFAWAFAHAEELGADPRLVGVGGDSAGGNLAAIVSEHFDKEHPRPAFQFLLYPAIDRSRPYDSMTLFARGFFLEAEDIAWFERLYTEGADRNDPRLVLLRSADRASLPPTAVVTAAFDPLRDEGEAYGKALREAGVPCLIHRVPGMIHGFINLLGVSTACRKATEEAADLLSETIRVAARDRDSDYGKMKAFSR